MLEIPLNWQQQYLYQCDWNNQKCPNSQLDNYENEIIVVSLPKVPLLVRAKTVLTSGESLAVTPEENTEGNAEIMQISDRLQVGPTDNFSTKEYQGMRLVWRQQNRPSS